MSKRKAEEKSYTVELVVDHFVNPSGKIEFLTKWKNYSSIHDSWEPKENFNEPGPFLDYFRSKPFKGVEVRTCR